MSSSSLSPRKKEITFDNIEVFGVQFKSGIRAITPILHKMILNDIINMDGYIIHKSKIKEYELWSYIYYLFYFNKDRIEIFKDMRMNKTSSHDERISAESLYYIVKQNTHDLKDNKKSVPLKKEKLIAFIHMILQNYKISNPVLDQYKRMIHKHSIKNDIESLDIKIKGDEHTSIVTDSLKAQEANVVIRIRSIR